MNSKGAYPVYPDHSVTVAYLFNSRVLLETSAAVEFGLIPKEHWVQPDWIDEEKAKEARTNMTEQKVLYAGTCAIFY